MELEAGSYSGLGRGVDDWYIHYWVLVGLNLMLMWCMAGVD